MDGQMNAGTDAQMSQKQYDPLTSDDYQYRIWPVFQAP